MEKFTGVYSKILFNVFFIAFLLYPFSSYPQSISNLDLFNTLADSSISVIVKDNSLKGKKLSIEKNIPQAYSVFFNQIISSFSKHTANPVNDSLYDLKISYMIEEAKVVYENMFRDGLLGSYYVERKVTLKGNYLLNSGLKKKESFTLASVDTVLYDDLKNYENPAFPFTRGEIPAEPFWSSVWEPAVAIGSAAVAVYLFFSVRSK